MSENIWKYSIEEAAFSGDGAVISMPPEAEVLTMQLQNDKPTIWVMFDERNTTRRVERRFRIFGTSNPIELETGKRRKYIGTFQMYGGRFVWHLFEIVDF